jgi:hypothetical protein
MNRLQSDLSFQSDIPEQSKRRWIGIFLDRGFLNCRRGRVYWCLRHLSQLNINNVIQRRYSLIQFRTDSHGVGNACIPFRPKTCFLTRRPIFKLFDSGKMWRRHVDVLKSVRIFLLRDYPVIYTPPVPTCTFRECGGFNQMILHM